MTSKTKRQSPLLILYSKGEPFGKTSKFRESAWQSDIAKAVHLLRKSENGIPSPTVPLPAPNTHLPMVLPKPRVTPQEKHLATGHLATSNFTHNEMKLPKDEHAAQLTKNPQELMGQAAQHKEHLDGLIDRGKGVGTQLGYHIVEGRVPTKEDYDIAHQKGGMVLMAPLKSEGRMKQKAQDNYGGDYSKMRDLSRASIAVSHPADIAHVTHRLRQAGLTYGSRPNDRFANPTEAGYSDIQTDVTHNGHHGELQIHSLDHLQAKEMGFPGHAGGVAGHKLYEELRDMKGKPKTPETVQRKEELNQQSQALYGEANWRMATRTPRLAHQMVEKAVVVPARFSSKWGMNTVGRRSKMENSHSSHSSHSHRTAQFVPPAQAHEKHGNGGHTTHNALQPGFFNWNGLPAKRVEYADTPVFFNGHKWDEVDEGKFAHEAHRIEEHEFNHLLALRHHQHGAHSTSL